MNQDRAVRQAIAAAIKAGRTRAGARVYANRPHGLPGGPKLPAIIVWTPSWRDEISQEAPREYKRTAEIQIELALEADGGEDLARDDAARAAAADKLDDLLDDFAAEVVPLLVLDETFGNACSDSRFSEGETFLLLEGARPLGVQRITLEVEYYWQAPAEGEPNLAPFRRMHLEHQTEGTNDAPEATDDLELEG